VHDAFGSGCTFEGRESPFKQLGINVNVVEPGPAALLSTTRRARRRTSSCSPAKCVLLVNEEERPLRPGTSSTARRASRT
jgi:hypothetical protein